MAFDLAPDAEAERPCDGLPDGAELRERRIVRPAPGAASMDGTRLALDLLRHLG